MYKEVSDQKTLNEESYHCFISKVTLKLSPDSCSQYITYLQWVTKILSSNYFLKFCGCLLVVCSHFLVLCNHLYTATCTEEAIQMAAKCLQKTNIYIYIFITVFTKESLQQIPYTLCSHFCGYLAGKWIQHMRWKVIHLHPYNKSHSYFYLEFVFLPEKCKQGKGYIAT